MVRTQRSYELIALFYDSTCAFAGTWGSRPRGLLLTSASAHNAAVTAIAVCQDHSFFATSSDDGTVKVWQTKGIDRDVTLASLLTYTGHLQVSCGRIPVRVS
jgi:WD40 repeat protein